HLLDSREHRGGGHHAARGKLDVRPPLTSPSLRPQEVTMAQQPAVQPVPPRLQRGGRVPHFHVTDTSAARVAYDEAIWQRDHLLLVSLGDDDGDPFAAIARDLQGR